MTHGGPRPPGEARGNPRPARRHRNARNRRLRRRRIVAAGIAILVVIGAWLAWNSVSDRMRGPADFEGRGNGSVTIEIKAGDKGIDIAKTLKAAGVVKSVDAYYEVSLGDPRAAGLQPGYYQIHKHMSAERALSALANPDNRVEGRVVIPEGSRVGQIVTAIVKGSTLTEDEVTAVLDKPETLGLPAAAHNNPEGYLFPATYTVQPDTSATELLQSMVDKTLRVEQKLNIGVRAKALGISTEDALTVASIIEYEAGAQQSDRRKVARVIYNRLDKKMPLQLDSTVTYVSKRKGDVWTTKSERNSDSLYNTYEHAGLPPGPIGSPGKKAIEAALNPAEGDWLYFVPVNLETGTTVFTDSYAEHQKNVKKFKEYCRGSDLC